MKKWAVLVAALGLFGVAGVAAPMISVDNPIYSETVQSGSRVNHSFILTNAGDEILSITNVRTSCGCTTAALDKRDLAPSESVDLAATVNTTGFHGTVTRTITVTTNDPVSPSVVLQIVVTIAETTPVVQEISVTDLKLVFYFLIDVRTPEEYAAGHLFGAMNIPLSEFQTNLATWLPRLPREAPIVLYSLDGASGALAATVLMQAGFSSVLNLAGGIAAWDNAFGQGYLYAF
jgi:rhodanese-related sulfurtransferase